MHWILVSCPDLEEVFTGTYAVMVFVFVRREGLTVDGTAGMLCAPGWSGTDNKINVDSSVAT